MLHNVGPHRIGGGCNSEYATKDVLPMTEQQRSSSTSDRVNAMRVHSEPKFIIIRGTLSFHQSSQLQFALVLPPPPDDDELHDVSNDVSAVVPPWATALFDDGVMNGRGARSGPDNGSFSSSGGTCAFPIRGGAYGRR